MPISNTLNIFFFKELKRKLEASFSLPFKSKVPLILIKIVFTETINEDFLSWIVLLHTKKLLFDSTNNLKFSTIFNY